MIFFGTDIILANLKEFSLNLKSEDFSFYKINFD